MSTDLTIPVPDDVMKRLQEMAAREYRTPAMQALWLIEHSLFARSGRPPADPEAARALAVALRELHARAGAPSSRKLAAEIGDMSHTTVAAAFRGHPVPTWDITERVVKGLGGDVEHFRRLWVAVRAGADD